MSLFRNKGIYLLSILITSGISLSASATELVVVSVTPHGTALTPATAPVHTLTETAPPIPEQPASVTSPESAPAAVSAQTATETAPPIPDQPASVTPPETVPTAVSAPAPVHPPAEPAPPTQEQLALVTPSETAPVPEKNVIPEQVTAESIEAAGISPAPLQMLDSEEQKRAYASGVMLAHFIEEQLATQKSLHITLNKNILLAGVADTLAHQVKMSDEDIRATMSTFDEQVKVLMQAQNEKKQAQEKAYVDAFAKRDGVKKTSQGLLYFIDKKGEGPALKDSDRVQVNYKGTLTDGTVVDEPKIENASEIFRIASMPPVLRDSVKLIRKGGQITTVIPPATLEKAKDANGESPLNTVVIYTISVVDVNPQQ